MLVINLSKRIISGINPGQSIELEKEYAEKLLRMYSKEIKLVKNNYELEKKVSKLKAENEKLKAENEKLKVENEKLKNAYEKNEDNKDDVDLITAKKLYFDKTGNKVPKRFSNNIEWILKKIEEFDK